MQDILVPVDGSQGANRAARFAAFLASELKAAVTLLHAYDAPTAAALGLAGQDKAAFDETIQGVARGSFERAKAEMGGFDVQVQTQVAVGDPAHEIVSHAQKTHPLMIVMGTRGLSQVKEALMGSVSDYVTRHAPCPVTIHR
ncbi:MAG: universal stress protein [Myxococcales bacterium]|nr:universal stress protein [Myxococcales bacterium]MDD9969242.1 universal stress protein [Myxococcales bacterium]